MQTLSVSDLANILLTSVSFTVSALATLRDFDLPVAPFRGRVVAGAWSRGSELVDVFN